MARENGKRGIWRRMVRWAMFALLFGSPLAHGHARFSPPSETTKLATASVALRAANHSDEIAVASLEMPGVHCEEAGCDACSGCCGQGSGAHCSACAHAIAAPGENWWFPAAAAVWRPVAHSPLTEYSTLPDPRPPRA